MYVRSVGMDFFFVIIIIVFTRGKQKVPRTTATNQGNIILCMCSRVRWREVGFFYINFLREAAYTHIHVGTTRILYIRRRNLSAARCFYIVNRVVVVAAAVSAATSWVVVLFYTVYTLNTHTRTLT